jgi:fatty-acyl-CoA synthase
MKPPDARTIPALLDEMARRYPERLFVIDADRRVTYRAFRLQARALAKCLYQLGVRKGDKVALLMGDQLEWLQVDFAVALLGAVLVAMNTWWRRSELQHALALADVKVLVMADSFDKINYTEELAAIGDLATAFPLLRQIVCMGSNCLPGALSFDALRQRGADVPDGAIDATMAAVAPDDIALILFTSGSTGRSKAAMLAHRGVIENPHAIGERMHLTEQDRVLLILSLFWSASCCNALFNVMTHGACIVLQKHYDPADVLRLIEQERCTAAYTTPNIVHAIYNLPERATRDLSSLRTGNCRPEVIDMLVEMGATAFCTTYGLTECYGQSCVADGHLPLELRRRTIGYPLPNTQMQIVDPDTRQLLPDGSVGEVRLRGYVMAGYYKDPEQAAKTIDSEGWLYTGDLGVMDQDGFRFQGRTKELIKTGGINVTPVEVEILLHLHPAVQQALVVGVPDPERDEIVAAMVVPRPGARLTVDELVKHCRKLAAAYKAPRYIEIVAEDRVPLTDTGKVNKQRLQAILGENYRKSRAA